MRILPAPTVYKISKLLQDNKQKISMQTLLNILNSNSREKFTAEEYLNYFVDLMTKVFKGEKHMSSSQISRLFSFMGTMASVIDDDHGHIDSAIVSKSSKLEALYKEYCDRENVEFSEHFSDLFKDCHKIILNCSSETFNEDSASYIIELDEKIKELEKENENLSIKISQLERISKSTATKHEKSIKSRDEKIKELQKQIKILNSNSKKSDKDKEILNITIEKLKAVVESLEAEIKNQEDAIEKINEENSRLNNRIFGLETALRQEKDNVESVKKSKEYTLGKTQLDNELLDNFILELILKEQLTLNEILEKLKSNNFGVSYYEVQQSLKRISARINVENQKYITGEPKYYVQSPSIISDKILTIPVEDSDCLDLMIISDTHFKNNVPSFNKTAMNRLYDVYDYCVQNGIDNIINLGDVVEEQETSFFEKENTREVKDLLSREEFLTKLSINFFPTEILGDITSSKIKQFVLGGNHDAEFAKLWGIDPIEALREFNPNLINMGYNDATLRFSLNPTGDTIGLHHKGIPREDKVGTIESINSVIEYIRKYCSRNGLLYSNDVFDLFGHIHRGRIDVNNGYSVVPSLTKDRSCQGAYHLKVHFDETKRIDYILIYPIVFEYQKVKPVNEIIYQRTRNK